MFSEHPLLLMVSVPTRMVDSCRQKGEKLMETRVTHSLQQISTIQNQSERWGVKRKVGNGRGGGGDSNPSDLVVNKRGKRKRKRKNEREMATPPRSDRCWSRSPSSGDEGRWRGPKIVVKWVFGLRQVGLGFSQEVSGEFFSASLNSIIKTWLWVVSQEVAIFHLQ